MCDVLQYSHCQNNVLYIAYISDVLQYSDYQKGLECSV